MYKTIAICLPLCMAVASDREQTTPPLITHPSQVSTESLPLGDPIAFLKECLNRFERGNVKGYEMRLLKQERINGRLQPSEEIEVHYLRDPHSVVFKWLKGQRLTNCALYVEGKNNDKVLANPAGLPGKLIPVVERDPEGPDAKQSGRYSLKEFGVYHTMKRTLRGFEREKAKGTLKVEYLGVVKVKELGDRLCYGFKRIDATPQDDGFSEVTVYVDKENWLQVGTILKGDDGKLYGEYLFRDIRMNPEFKPEQFTKAILTQ